MTSSIVDIRVVYDGTIEMAEAYTLYNGVKGQLGTGHVKEFNFKITDDDEVKP